MKQTQDKEETMHKTPLEEIDFYQKILELEGDTIKIWGCRIQKTRRE